MPLDPFHKRVIDLNGRPISSDGACVIYWMQRSQRARDNLALKFALELANSLGKPVVTYFGLFDRYPMASPRAFKFMLEGLKETALETQDLGIGFVLRRENPSEGVAAAAEELDACAVVVDEDYLNLGRKWRADAAAHLQVKLFQVDAETVVAARITDREEWGAYTLRPKILRVSRDWLVEFPSAKPARPWRLQVEGIDPRSLDVEQVVRSIDAEHSVRPVPNRVGGTSQALRVMEIFIAEKLPRYASQRNDIGADVTSGLSPYLHFGQISSVRVALEVGAADVPDDCADAFLEQIIVRRELAINFCLYNPNYFSLAAAPRWALETLSKHRGDPRPESYTLTELESAATHDELWNAAQLELVRYGTIHPYMRMVWAKKLLEWCPSPEEALAAAIYLNDKYALDGRDPNGYANIAWCIYGKHDRPFRERPIFGKVRYMSTEGVKRKTRWQKYLQRMSPECS